MSGETRICPGHDCGASLRDGYLCRSCQRRAERILSDLPALARELEVTVTRQDRISRPGKRGKGAAQPSVVNFTAEQRGRRESELLFEWTDFVAAWYGTKGLPLFARHVPLGQLIPASVSLLLGRSDWMRSHEQGPELASAIWYVRSGLSRIVDCREERLYAGPCHADLGYDQPYLCQFGLYRKWGAEDIVCDGHRPGVPGLSAGCGTIHPAAERHAFLVASVEEQLLPLKLVWESLYVLIPGCEVAWKTAQQWTKPRHERLTVATKVGGERVRIRTTPPRLTEASVDWRGQPLYRGDDILRLAQDKRPRRGRRRVQRAEVA